MSLSARFAEVRRQTGRAGIAQLVRLERMPYLVMGALLAVFLLMLGHKVAAGRADALDSGERELRNLITGIEQHAQGALSEVALVLAGTADWAGMDAAGLARHLDSRRRFVPQILAVELVDARGEVRVAAGAARSTPAVRQEHADGHRAGQPLVVGKRTLAANGAGGYVAVSRPVPGPDGAADGMVLVLVDPAHFQRYYGALDVGPKLAIALVRSDGEYLVREPHRADIFARNIASADLFQKHLPQAPRGTFRGPAPADGVQRLAAYAALDGYPVVAAVGVDEDELFAAWRRSTLFDAGVGLAATVLSLVLAAALATRLRERRIAEERFARAIQASDIALMEQALPGGTLHASPRLAPMLGYRADELPPLEECVVEADRPAFVAARERSVRTGLQLDDEFRLRTRSGGELWVRVRGGPIGGVGDAATHFSGTVTNITAHKAVQLRAETLTLTYAALSRTNEAIARTQEVDAMLAAVCRIAVEEGRFVTAYVGIAGEDGIVVPKATAGRTAGLFGERGFSLSPEDPVSRGPMGTVIRTGAAYVCNDFLGDPNTAPARDEATRLGIRSSASFPLQLDGKVIGALSVYAPRPDVFSPELVKLLADMADDVSLGLARLAREAEVRRLAEELESRVAQRTAALEAAVRELESFSYSVSHDLRAPLRAINGFAQMLEEHGSAALDAEGRRLLTVIRRNTAHMTDLIDDLLRLARVSRVELAVMRVDVASLAREVAEDLAAGHPNVRFEIGALPEVDADLGLLRQALVNLVGNAVKFSSKRDGAVVRISGASGDGEKVFSVADNGAGFDMEFVDKLFGVFQRLHGVREFEGTGIGLAIVKRIVERHGGRVWAEGRVGEGATFSFALPARAPGS